MGAMNITLLPEKLCICRLAPDAGIPAWLPSSGFVSLTRTADELSIVCPEETVPEEVICDRGWRGLQVEGPLDFSLIGVLVSLADPLAEAGVSLFAVSTYNTDYILVKQAQLSDAHLALTAAGHRITSELD